MPDDAKAVDPLEQMVLLNLAPSLPGSLRLPRNLKRWNGATVDVRFITVELLVSFGLN